MGVGGGSCGEAERAEELTPGVSKEKRAKGNNTCQGRRRHDGCKPTATLAMSLHLSLIAASNTCSAALQSLAAVHCARPSPPPLPVLQNDLSSLLSLLRLTTVKSALAFNDSAALTPINDLSAHIDALVHCALLFSPDVHGATLTKEVVSTITVVVEAVAALVHSFLAGGEVYLVRIGEVHDLIDKAMDVSKDNLAAVRKRWAEDRATLDDAFRELGEMLEGGDGDQDGWDELGLGSKMDENELERAKQVSPLAHSPEARTDP